MPTSYSLLMSNLGTRELLGNLHWSPRTFPACLLLCTKWSTLSGQYQPPLDLRVQDHLVFLFWACLFLLCQQWMSRENSKLVEVHEVKWCVTKLALLCTKLLVLTLKNTFKYQDNTITHFHVYIMYAFWTSFRTVKRLLANSHLLSEYRLSLMQ